MKNGVFLTAVVVFFSSFARGGVTKPYTIGAIIGDPTGFSGKYMLTDDTAIDGAAAWGFGARSGTQVHADYLQFHEGQISAGDAELDLYYGFGGRLVLVNGGGDSGKLAMGPRAPLGILHKTVDPNLEYFGEAALILDFIPSTALDLDLAVGLRFRF